MSPARRTACDSCYKRKIQCDAPKLGDPCNWCQHHDLACTYDRPSRTTISSRSKHRNKGALDIAKRLELLESRIAHVNRLHQASTSSEAPDNTQAPTRKKRPSYSSVGACVPPPGTTSASASPTPSLLDGGNPQGQIYFHSNNLGTLSSPTGLPVFTERCKKWIRAATGEWPEFDLLDDHDNPIPPPAPQQDLAAGSSALPEPWILELLVESYMKSDFGRTLPFIDSVLFKETARLAYVVSDQSDTTAHLSAAACTLAFCAIASSKMHQVEGADRIDARCCTRQAELLLNRIPGDESLSTLQATMMLLAWKAHLGDAAAVRTHHAVACRIVFALGGHTRVPSMIPNDRKPTPQERHDHNLRCLFWLCYFFDKDAALRTGLPPTIGDEYCDLTLPDGYLELIYGGHHGPLEPDQLPMPWLISDLRLSQIKSKVAKELYSFASTKKSDAELLLTIRQLDEELERWRLTIPAQFAPSLAIRHGVKLSEHLMQSEKMLHIDLHLAYHHLLSIIHRASERCAGNLESAASEFNFGVQSSLDLSVEASRSTLIFLSLAVHHLASETFWIFTFYPITAFLSLFFNLLRSPGNEYAELDLELIRTASEVLRRMPKGDPSPRETAYLDGIDRFCEEISRLAECAITRHHTKSG